MAVLLPRIGIDIGYIFRGQNRDYEWKRAILKLQLEESSGIRMAWGWQFQYHRGKSIAIMKIQNPATDDL